MNCEKWHIVATIGTIYLKEYWLGKTKAVEANSTVELIINFVINVKNFVVGIKNSWGKKENERQK